MKASRFLFIILFAFMLIAPTANTYGANKYTKPKTTLVSKRKYKKSKRNKSKSVNFYIHGRTKKCSFSKKCKVK